MRITFVLPMYLNVPSGGFKVVYEYANQLCRRGHQVTVIHPRNISATKDWADRLKASLWRYKIQLQNRPLLPWFDVEERVCLSLVSDLNERYIPAGDVIFATAYQTAFPVAAYGPAKGRKFYLVQSYETWSGDERDVLASWALPLHKIVISQHLLKLPCARGEENRTTYIPNGVDLSTFKIKAPISDRELRIGMLAHPNEAKGLKDGIQALQIVKEQMPQLQASLFGTEPRNPEIPSWIEYTRCPSPAQLVKLYNSCRVFLSPSWAEGWGLPSAEAMACGCALVSADNGGVDEFAVDDESALIAPIKSPVSLAEKILRLLSDDALRIRLAEAGNRNVGQFTWERAVNSLEQVIASADWKR